VCLNSLRRSYHLNFQGTVRLVAAKQSGWGMAIVMTITTTAGATGMAVTAVDRFPAMTTATAAIARILTVNIMAQSATRNVPLP